MLHRFVLIGILFLSLVGITTVSAAADDDSNLALMGTFPSDNLQYPNEEQPIDPAYTPPPVGKTGIVVNVNHCSLQMINPASNKVSAPFGRMFIKPLSNAMDVAITPDGKTALVSLFVERCVLFFDIHNPAEPHCLGSVYFPFFAEDIDISADGKYAFVTSGGGSYSVGVIDIPNRTQLGVCSLGGAMAQAVAAVPDGRTILVVDYWGRCVWVLLFDPLKVRMEIARKINLGDMEPVNVTVSPDGRTAVVVNSSTTKYTQAVLRIDGPGQVVRSQWLDLEHGDHETASAVFSVDGKKLYLRSIGRPGYVIRVADVTGPGKVEYHGEFIPIQHRPQSNGCFFGVDTLAIEPAGRYLYATNTTGSGQTFQTAVLDLASGQHIDNLPTHNPTGIAFPRPPADVQVTQSADRTKVEVNEPVTFTVRVHNNSNDDVYHIVLEAALPANLAYIGHTAGAGEYDPARGEWSLPLLPAGGDAVLTLSTRVVTAGSCHPTIRKTAQSPWDDKSDNDSSTLWIYAGDKLGISSR